MVAGHTLSNDGDVTGFHTGVHGVHNDAWVVKLDAAGTLVWQKCLGGTSDDFGRAVQQTADGGYMVAGLTLSTDGDVAGNHGGYDAWVVKLDAAGTLVWQKCLGGTGTDYANAVQQTADGGYIVAGQTHSTSGDVTGNHGEYDAWVVKLDAAGILVWQRCFGGRIPITPTRCSRLRTAAISWPGHTGSTDGDVTGNHGGDDAWVVKRDAAGILVWQRCFGGTYSDYANTVQQTADWRLYHGRVGVID